MRDAQIEDIARAVGVNRAIIYRHFSGKEELFALTLVSYLDDLEERLAKASRSKRTPMSRLVAVTEEFVDFGLEHPAFVDCAQTLMRRPGPELLEEISESSLFRLGRGISACLKQVSDILDAGKRVRRLPRRRTPRCSPTTCTPAASAPSSSPASACWCSESAPGIPAIAPVSPDQVKKYVVATAKALATG